MPDTGKKPTYHLTTFGCQMNEHDSERIRGVLEENGWISADEPGEADLLVYNTCSVRKSAETRLLGRLGEASRLKKERPGRMVALGGCFAQSRKEEIFSDLPFLDVAFGPRNIGDLPALLSRAAETSVFAGTFEDDPLPSAALPARRASRHHAWIQVMTGCTNFCAYCVVPSVRGPERSRPPEDVVEEAKRLIDDGVVEITLLGQNVNAYGLENGQRRSGGTDFAGLLEMLDALDGLERIRFTTSHPKDLDGRLISALRDLQKVCEHLHLPAQSGSTRILKRMRRRYTREHYMELVSRLREAVPGLALTTDLIVGFPGEREDDFYRTLTLAGECRFDGAFTFKFSPRKGTEAADLPGRVPDITVRRRMQELVDLTQKVAIERNRVLIRSAQQVLVEGESRQGGGQFRGRTRANKIVNFQVAGPGPGGEPAPGDLVEVHIDSATSTTLKGTKSD